jgi:cell division protein FtsA
MLSSIVEARVQEILSVAKFKIENKTKVENLSFGIILTGGGSELRNITEFSENIFSCNIRIGKPMKNIETVEDHIFRPKYSTAIGIIKYAVDHKEDLGIKSVGTKRGLLGDFITNIKELWNN